MLAHGRSRRCGHKHGDPEGEQVLYAPQGRHMPEQHQRLATVYDDFQAAMECLGRLRSFRIRGPRRTFPGPRPSMDGRKSSPAPPSPAFSRSAGLACFKFCQRSFQVPDVVQRELPGFYELGHQRAWGTAENVKQLVNQPAVRCLTSDYRFKDVRVADFFDAAHRAFFFQTVDDCLHRRVGRTFLFREVAPEFRAPRRFRAPTRRP